MKFKDAAFMGIMRWTFYNTLKEQYEPDIPVHYTYGYITKNTRINHNLPKGHCGVFSSMQISMEQGTSCVKNIHMLMMDRI